MTHISLPAAAVLNSALQPALRDAEWGEKHIHPCYGETYQTWKVSIYLPVPLSVANKGAELALLRWAQVEAGRVEEEARAAEGRRDALCGSSRVMMAGPFASEQDAGAAMAAMSPDDFDPEHRYFVGRISNGLRAEPKPMDPAIDDGSDDIAF